MLTEPRQRKHVTVTFGVPDHPDNRVRASSFAESDGDYELSMSAMNPVTLSIAKALRSTKTFKRSWDSDKALKSTYKGFIGKYQLRAYLLLAFGFGIIGAWFTGMPRFATLPPKSYDCTPIYPNEPNITNSSSIMSNLTVSIATEKQKAKPKYNFTEEYGRTMLTELNLFCDKTNIKIPFIIYILGFIIGGLIFGYLADHSGRKMILLGSLWTACVLSIFQLLSEDYISYVFFIFFIAMAIGAVHVISVPYVMEMFPIESRAMYGLSLFGVIFLLDLIIPWLGVAIKHWKVLQAVISIPLILTAALYWFSEESMFWNTAQKDYAEAVLSLTKIAQFNGIRFDQLFREASNFLHGKHSVGIQCDFQPLLRLEDIKVLGSKYPDFDMVDLQATTGKKDSLSKRLLEVLTGHHYYPTLSTFYPTDFLHSTVLTLYLLVMCGLWLVSSLTEYGLDSPHLTQHLTDDFFHNYFYTHLIQIISFIVTVPLVYSWGRRWPTFCFFLIAEVCLLGSVAVNLDDQNTRSGMLVVYFTGKFATRAAFIVIAVYTCEIFPTGLRCTTLGICYTFRLIGIALASPYVGELNDWMPRLIYGILSLILGAMALLLPETKKFPLPRTIVQVESLPTSISEAFHRKRSRFTQPRSLMADPTNLLQDPYPSAHGPFSIRSYDNQSTLHSIYEVQEITQNDTIYPPTYNRSPSRRNDLHSIGIVNDTNRTQQSIAEDDEYGEDVDDDQTRISLQRRLKDKKQIIKKPDSIIHTNEDVIVPTKEEIVEPIEIDDKVKTTEDHIEHQQDSPRFQRAMSQDENYFSEHC